MTQGAVSVSAGRDIVRRYHLLLGTYVVFVCLILLATNPVIYRWVYLAAVLPCFALTVDAPTLQAAMRSTVWRAAAALLLALWFSVLWGERPDTAEFVDYGGRALGIALFVLVTAWLAATRPNFARLLFRFLIAAAAGIAVASVARQIAVADLLARPRVLTIANANAAGAVYGVLVMGGLFYALPETASAAKRRLIIAGLLIMALFIGVTQSRGNLLALGFGLLLLAALAHVREAAVALMVGIAVIALLLAVGLLDVGELMARGLSYRLEAWQHYLELWRQRPWLGVGANVVKPFTVTDPFREAVFANPQSLYLSPLVSGGIVAFTLFALLFAAALRAAWRAHRRRGDIGLLAMLMFVGLTGLVEFGLAIDHPDWQWLLFWLPIGLVAGAEVRHRRGDAQAAENPA
jgi:O-antigen ligase